MALHIASLSRKAIRDIHKHMKKFFRQVYQGLSKIPKWISVSTVIAIIGVVIAYLQLSDNRLYEMIDKSFAEYQLVRPVDVPDSVVQSNHIILQSVNLQSKIRLYYQLVNSINPQNSRETTESMANIGRLLKLIVEVSDIETEIRSEFMVLCLSISNNTNSEAILNSIDIKHLQDITEIHERYTKFLYQKEPEISIQLKKGNKQKAKTLLYDIIESKQFYDYLKSTLDMNNQIFRFANVVIENELTQKRCN